MSKEIKTAKAPRRSFYTILILPHARQRFRKLHISRNFILSVAGVATVALVAGLSAPHLFLRMQTQAAALESLQDENSRLRDDRNQFEARLTEMSKRLNTFEAQTGAMADALGIRELPSFKPAGGAGGGELPAARRNSLLEQELYSIQTRSHTLDSSLEHIDQALQERMAFLASEPNMLPAEGWFSHGFGWRKDPFTGKRQFHRGIDIVADAGSPILAPAHGTVTRAVRVSDYGRTVDLDHGYGYKTRYAHMSQILVKPGQAVKRGEIIGRVGSTGRSTGPHLHYEVFRDDRRVNPWKYLGQ